MWSEAFADYTMDAIFEKMEKDYVQGWRCN